MAEKTESLESQGITNPVLNTEVERLANWFQKEWPEQIGKCGSAGAIDEAIRLLKALRQLQGRLDCEPDRSWQ